MRPILPTMIREMAASNRKRRTQVPSLLTDEREKAITIEIRTDLEAILSKLGRTTKPNHNNDTTFVESYDLHVDYDTISSNHWRSEDWQLGLITLAKSFTKKYFNLDSWESDDDDAEMQSEGIVRSPKTMGLIAIAIAEKPGVADTDENFKSGVRKQLVDAVTHAIEDDLDDLITDLKVELEVNTTKERGVSKNLHTDEVTMATYEQVLIVAGFRWKHEAVPHIRTSDTDHKTKLINKLALKADVVASQLGLTTKQLIAKLHKELD